MKNYYQILGVHPSAEIVVIKAAYRVLAQKYHPDKNNASDESQKKMQEINEAYEVLSDELKRAEYDKNFKSDTNHNEDNFSDDSEMEDAFESALQEIESRWDLVVEIFPKLGLLRANLQVIAHRLAYAFVILILDTKKFDIADEIASKLKHEFLVNHFGTDSKVLQFAEELIILRFRDAVKGLNRLVDVLGSSVPSEKVISNIKEKFNLRNRLEAIKEDPIAKPIWIKWFDFSGLLFVIESSKSLEDLDHVISALELEVWKKDFSYYFRGKNVQNGVMNVSSFNELKWFLKHQLELLKKKS